MTTQEIVDHARNFAIMVRVQGPVSHYYYLSCPFSMSELAVSVEMVKNQCVLCGLGPEGPEDAKAGISSVPVSKSNDRFIKGLHVFNLKKIS